MWEHFEGEEDWPVDGISYDDLIRLVVGMQWQVAMAQAIIVEIRNDDGSWTVSTRPGGGLTRLQWNECGAPDIDLRPAVDIVDEWLGVR